MSVKTALMESLENRQLLSVPFFNQTNLVSDTSGTPAAHHHANLVNPWGLAAAPNGPWRVANKTTGTRTASMREGQAVGYAVRFPGAAGVAGHDTSTRIVA